MDYFYNAKAVRLRSRHMKYLYAEEDEKSIKQDRDGASRNTRWTVEFIDGVDDHVRLKSCYGKYMTASDHAFLLGATGQKVTQEAANSRRNPAIEWEPIREYNQVKLKTCSGKYLRANGGLPPWRNSVTHDVPLRSSTQDWILWDVHVLERITQSPEELQIKQDNLPVARSSSTPSQTVSPSAHLHERSASAHLPKPTRFAKQEVQDLTASHSLPAQTGRSTVSSQARRADIASGLSIASSVATIGSIAYQVSKEPAAAPTVSTVPTEPTVATPDDSSDSVFENIGEIFSGIFG